MSALLSELSRDDGPGFLAGSLSAWLVFGSIVLVTFAFQ